MAENEIRILEGLSTLPDPVKQDFLQQLKGAATAVAALNKAESATDAEPAKTG